MIVDLVKSINDDIKSNRALRAAVSSVLALYLDRIFVKGEASDNSKIGKYSTNPISIAKSNQARNTNKTYFKGGYDEYKSKVGRNPGFVNLRNTDQLSLGIVMVENDDSIQIGTYSDFDYNKARWNEQKFKKNIFDLTTSELSTLLDELDGDIK